jgi:hypothetical protein
VPHCRKFTLQKFFVAVYGVTTIISVTIGKRPNPRSRVIKLTGTTCTNNVPLDPKLKLKSLPKGSLKLNQGKLLKGDY